MTSSRRPKIRLGVAGAPRGKAFLAGLAAYEDTCEMVAVYEPEPEARAAFAPGDIATPDRYDEMLELVDAVIVASPQHHHVPQAVAALQRGVHVLSEVPAAVSLEQAQQLLAAARQSTAVYMIAENYCYTRANLTIREMAARGLFGELYFGEGEYLHEMKSWHTRPDGTRTWRYYWQVGRGGNTYPTHSIGPLLQWFGDRITAVSCVGTGRHTDPEHEIDDTVLLLARTSRGALLKIRLDLLSNRPHLMNYYSVQGTRGSYEADRGPVSLGQADRVRAGRVRARWARSTSSNAARRAAGNPSKNTWTSSFPLDIGKSPRTPATGGPIPGRSVSSSTPSPIVGSRRWTFTPPLT